MSAPRHYIRILTSVDGQWYFVLKAGNGRTVMTSETYKTRYDVERATRPLRDLGRLVVVWDEE